MFALATWSMVGALVASRAVSFIRAPSRVLILQGGAWTGLGNSGDEASLIISMFSSVCVVPTVDRESRHCGGVDRACLHFVGA